MKARKAALFGLLFPGLVFLFSFEQPRYLIKIWKGIPAQTEILLTEQIDILQELEGCFIARAGRNDLVVLRRNQIAFTVLDRDTGGRQYFLINAAGHRDPSTLAERLRVSGGPISRNSAQILDEGTILFRTDADSPRDVIPSDLEFIPIASSVVLPNPRTLPSYGGERSFFAADDIVRAIAAEVSGDNLRAFVKSLQDFQTRFASTPNCEAAGQHIFNYFQTIGLETSFQTFTFGSNNTSRNVVAEHKGGVYPEDVFIICGHYDSYSPAEQRLTQAPGADDNASGTAAVMEAARILVRYPLDFTVRFIAFSAEELGLIGARAYASERKSRGENIIGVINLDMIAYADAMPEDLDVIVNAASEWMAERTELASRAYTTLATKKTVDASFVYSDHAAFWEKGYAALCGIEDNPVRNPFYHKITDTLETLNIDFHRDSTRLALAVLAELAQPVRAGVPKTPTGLSAKGSTYSSLFNAVKDVVLTWDAVPGASGYNVYRSLLSHLSYQKLTGSPVTTASYTDKQIDTMRPYFYVVTAVGPTGLESNLSKEVQVDADRLALPLAASKGASTMNGGGHR